MTKASVERYDFTEHTPYELSALPRSLTACGDWETLIAVLTYIGFVDAKCRTGASAELLADYTRARAQIPDAIQEQHAEDARRRRLRNYAEGLAQHPEAIRIPPSVYLPGASASASKRHLAPRGRVAALSAFESFLRTQLEALTRFGSSRGFAVQQAHSAAATGPVSESAAGALGRFPSTPFVLCEPAFRPTYATRQATRHTITLPDAHFRCIAMTPDGSRAATGGDDAIIRLWDIEAGQCLRILRDQPDRVFAVALSADGRRLVSGTYDGRIRYWDTENGDLLHEVAAHEGTVLAVGISADGAILVSGGEDRIVRVWRDSTCVCSLSQESQTSVRCVALTPDGSRAVCGHFVDPEEPNSNTILLNLWDMHRGTLLRSFWQSDGVCCVDLAQNGRCCVSGDTKGNVCLWHDDADRPTMVLPTGGTWIRGVRLSADGDLLFALDDAGCLRVWRVQTGELVRRLRVHTAD